MTTFTYVHDASTVLPLKALPNGNRNGKKGRCCIQCDMAMGHLPQLPPLGALAL